MSTSHRALRLIAATLCLATAACPATEQPTRQTKKAAEAPLVPQVGYLKGQTHLHSSRSGDSQTPPEEVARWYKARGYDFIVFTDHDHITDIPDFEGMLTIPGVELTQNMRVCDPPPEGKMACLLHVNALFVAPQPSPRIAWPTLTSTRRLDIFERALKVNARLGGLVQLNHPNFHYAADAALIGELASRGVGFVEIANEAVDSNNEGDADHPSTEALWDAALTVGARIYGIASDDAHHYNDAQSVRAKGELAHTGDRGFVMVRAAKDPAAIRAAMARGDFYSSNGLLLSRVERKGDTLHVHVAEGQGACKITFIGPGGATLTEGETPSASHAIPQGSKAYLRALVTDKKGRKAWTQPIFR